MPEEDEGIVGIVPAQEGVSEVKLMKERTVLRVGDGRGFVVQHRGRLKRRLGRERLVITAAHCLPFLPPPMRAGCLEERIYPKLLGPLGEEPTVWCQCLFVDPVADLAVLGEPDNRADVAVLGGDPDNQELSEEYSCYEEFIQRFKPLQIGKLRLRRDRINHGNWSYLSRPEAECDARMLSLDGRWFGCHLQVYEQALIITSQDEPTQCGMSGSPIIQTDGSAISLVTTGTFVKGSPSLAQGWNELNEPVLTSCLPAWMRC